VERRFNLLAPAKGPGLPPLVLLLHGSGRDGRAMLDMWQGVAGSGALLLAPDARDKQGWSVEDDGPEFLNAVLAQAAQVAPFDPQRVYVYGHSAGANMALYLGQCTDFPVRAVAIHAGALAPCPAHSRPAHSRPTRRPYLIQIGDRDATFPLADVRASAQGIAASGSPVVLEVIPGHSHWYYDAGPALAADAWAFFRRQ
jgi:predicted esterase